MEVQHSSFQTTLLRRWGKQYIWRATLLAQSASLLAASLGIYYIALNVRLNEIQLRLLIQSVFSLVIGAIVIVAIYGYRISRQTRLFLAIPSETAESPSVDGAGEAAQAAWREITAYPWRMARFASSIALFEVILPAALYMYWFGGMSLGQAAHVVIGGIISAGGLILYFFFMVEWLMEPVYRELLQHTPALPVPAGPSVHSRLLIVYLSFSTIALLMVAALAYQRAVDLTLPGSEAAVILRTLQMQLMGVGGVALLLIVGFSYLLARSVSVPIRHLTETMGEIEAGRLQQRAKVVATNELGHLALAFNRMIAQLEALNTQLEQRVNERTADLARRSTQLEAAAEVAREAAAIRDVRTLLDTTVRLISERFGFYHAGIFLIDPQGEYAVLQAASSEGGARMLARRHKLAVGKTGIVGYVAHTGKPRIALDVGQDAVFFDNTDLPETRSEIALPLKIRERILGVLDVQSTQAAAFGQEEVAILQTLADQVALAIENARLLEESQQTLHELETLYGQQAYQAWQEYTTREPIAYRYTLSGVESVPFLRANGETRLPLPLSGFRKNKDDRQLIVPIRLRGQTIGSLVLRRDPRERPWSPEEIAMAETVIAEAALALENARLLNETQRRAEIERIVGQIAARMQETPDLDLLVRVAASETQRAFRLPEVIIQLNPPSAEKNPEVNR